MKQYTFPELERTAGPWRKVAKVLLVAVVFLASFAFAFFQVGPWVKELRSGPDDAVLSDADASAVGSLDADSVSDAGSDESRVWVVPHADGAGPAPERAPGGQAGAVTPSGDEPDSEGPREEAEPETQDGEAEVEPPPETEPGLPERITTTFYRVQLGVFAERERAQQLSDELVERGYSTYVSQTQSEGQVLYKVQVGAFEDEGNARILALDLEAAGYDVVVTSSPG